MVDSIQVKLIARMQEVAIMIDSDAKEIARLKIENLNAGIIVKTSYTEVSAKLQDIVITDRNPKSIHPIVLSVIGGKALSCQVVLYNLKETSVYNSDEMKIDVSMGCVKVVFLNLFVTSLLVCSFYWPIYVPIYYILWFFVEFSGQFSIGPSGRCRSKRGRCRNRQTEYGRCVHERYENAIKYPDQSSHHSFARRFTIEQCNLYWFRLLAHC